MAVYDVIPKENITNDDISDTLRHHGGIDMFSKRKPVPLKVNFCQDFDENKPDYLPEWWRGKDGNCGISIPVFTTMDEVGDVTNGTLNGWTYIEPKGGEDEPFRMGDWAGYCAIAEPPFKSFSVPERVEQGGVLTCQFTYNPITQDGDSLTISDFGGLENCYLGVKVYNSSKNEQYWNTTTKPIKEGADGYKVDIQMSSLSLSAGWVAFPFLCTKQQPQNAVLDGSARYYALPKIDKATFDVVSSVDELNVKAIYIYMSEGATIPSKLQWKYSYKNNSGKATSGNRLYIAQTNSFLDGYLYEKELPPFSINMNDEFRYPMDVNENEYETIDLVRNPPFDATKGNYLIVSIDNGRIVNYAPIAKQVVE